MTVRASYLTGSNRFQPAIKHLEHT